MMLESDTWLLAESSGLSFDPLSFSLVPEAIDLALECDPGFGVTVAWAWARVGCVAVEAELEVLIRLAVGGTPLPSLSLSLSLSLDLACESACTLSLRRATCCRVATGELGEAGLLLLLSLCELPMVEVAPARYHSPPALFLFPCLFGHAEPPIGLAQQTAVSRRSESAAPDCGFV